MKARNRFKYVLLVGIISLSVGAMYNVGPARAQKKKKPASPGAVFTVTNTNDSGAGSLRQAIIDSNSSLADDTIVFNIPGAGVHTISLLSALPDINDTVNIDGSSQPGYTGAPLIELSGSNAGSASGITILDEGEDSEIRGLVINGFEGRGIQIFNARNISIYGNYIGTNAEGSAALSNESIGIWILNSGGNSIGGSAPGEKNLVSGNGTGGGFENIRIEGSGSDENVVIGNIIGPDITGTVSLSQGIGSGTGLFLISAGGNFIGDSDGGGNIISGNGVHGIAITGNTAVYNEIRFNSIGVDFNGNASLGNTFAGVHIVAASQNSLNANTIAGNNTQGLLLEITSENTILANSIHSNGNLGIDLGNDGVSLNDNLDTDSGANSLQNFPVLTSAIASGGSTVIQGSLNSSSNDNFLVEFFSSSTCDSSGNGEGEVYLGSDIVTTNGSGDAPISVNVPLVPANMFVTATATDFDGDDDNPQETSEFSACIMSVVTPGTLQFNGPAYGVYEGQTSPPITVSRTGGSDGAVTVDWFASGADTVPGQNGGTLVWGPGDTTDKSFVVPTLDNAVVDGDRAIILQLSNPTGGATIGPPVTHPLFVLDNENQGSISINDVSKVEGTGGTTAFTFNVTITRSGPGTVFVNYATADGTATSPGDYQGVPSTFLQFNQGGVNTREVTVLVNGDSAAEIDETFFVNLIQTGNNYTVSDGTGTGTILNDDFPTVNVQRTPASVKENGNGNIVYTFTRSSVSADPLPVSFSIAGTADASDFTSVPSGSIITIPGGQSTAQLTIDPTSDNNVEPDETVSVSVAPGAGYVLGSPQAADGTIVNDDAEITITANPLSVTEDGSGSIIYKLTRTGFVDDGLPVNISIGGTATLQTDYALTGLPPTAPPPDGRGEASPSIPHVTLPVVFSPGTTTLELTADPIADSNVEPDETVVFEILPGVNYVSGSPQTAEGKILNDDSEVTITASPPSVTEDGPGVITYKLTRTGFIGAPLNVNIGVDGTATFQTDYVMTGISGPTQEARSSKTEALAGPVVFSAGSDTAEIVVDPTADSLVEADETVEMSVLPGSGYTAGGPQSASTTILNDDATITVSADPVSIAEDGAGTIRYTFTRTGFLGSQMNVNVNVEGTADPQTDYVLTVTGTTGQQMKSPRALSIVVPIVFSPGSQTEELTIDPIADQDVEPDETIVINVLPGPGYDGGGAGGTIVTIASDDFCPPIPIGYGEQLPGVLDDTSCVVDGEKTDTYSFEGQPGDRIVITLYADGFSPRVVLGNTSGLLAQGGGDGAARDLRIPDANQSLTLPAGINTSYTITVSALSGGSGEYKVALYKLPAAECTYSLSPDGTFIASTGGTFSFDVITQPGCPPERQPVSSGSIYKNLTYRGGRVTFDVDPNPSLIQRQDAIEVGQRTHSLIQYGRAVPTNDNFEDAEQLTGNSSDDNTSRAASADASVTGNNTAATPQLNEPLHAGNPVAKSVWYYWTPPAGSGLYSFSTSGSNFDTVMAVYACPLSGDCLISNAMPVGSNDDTTSFDKTSKVNFRANAGTKYMIAVDGKNGANGTIELTWRQYRRLFRLYLQNYNGYPSTLVPDSIVASNGSNTEDAARVSLGVYEFDLPADNTTYTVSISGPAGIIWNPNNITLEPSSSGMDELMQGPDSGSQNSTSNAQDQTPRYITGYIQNLAAPDIPALSMAISSSRGPNPRSEALCTPFGTTIQNSIQYVTYQCLSQPQTLHDIEPRMPGKNFIKPALSFSHPIEAPLKGTPATAFVATDVPTYGIAGRVLAGGPGTIVDLQYVPKGNSIEITRRTVTGPMGAYTFPSLPSNQYKLKAFRPGFVFSQPPAVDLQSNRDIDIPAEVACTYTPANLSTIAQSGGLNQFSITTNDGRCEWQATSDVSWIVINSGATVGTGPVHFTVEPNGTGALRTGTVRISDRPEPVNVRQAAGTSAMVSVSGKILSPSGNGTRASVTITDGTGARRSVVSNALGIYTFQNVASGAEYTIAVNSKRFRFTPKTMLITAELSNLDFAGIE